MVPNSGWLPGAVKEAGIPSEIRGMKGLVSYRNMANIVRRIRRGEIQVVHTHLTRAAYFGHMLGTLTKVPVITSVHIANNDQIYKRLARGNNRLVAVSHFVGGMLKGRGIDQKYVVTVYNGTDFVDIGPTDTAMVKSELGIPENRTLVGLIGKVCLDKGQIELVQAMPAVLKEHPNVHMVFVGRIDAAFRPELNAEIESAGVSDRITLTGVRHDIPRMLDSLALCTLPSRMETFGVAAIEAMARSRAVVATRVGALPEVVKHKQTGLLVDLRPSEIAEAVNYLLEQDDEREEMGRMGRFVVEQKFTLGEMVSRFEKVYDEAVSR
jgi:glycosyltransferase involved in cell wall biosynthesis